MKFENILTVSGIAGEPLLYDEKCYFLKAPNNLICYSISNRIKEWQLKLNEKFVKGGNVPMLFSSDEDILVNGTREIVLVNSKSGKVNWILEGGNLNDHPFIYDSKVKGIYFKSVFDYFICEIDLKKKKMSEYEIEYSGVDFQGINEDSFIYWEDSCIYSMQYKSGKTNWKFDVAKLGQYKELGSNLMDGEVIGNPLLIDSLAIFNVKGYHLIALNIVSGDLAWKFENQNLNSVNKISIRGETLFALGFDAFYEINLSTGTAKKEVITKSIFKEKKITMLSRHYVIGDHIVFLFSHPNTKLGVIRRDPFQLEAVFDFKGTVWPNNFLYKDGVFVVRSFEGDLNLFKLNGLEI
ncbi:MAG: hypothetical protein H6558_12190 [Lewinellaceae bacterium]|nr:hypothetical protein [Phaeodactylibacter sp.]MCB9265777.1 hypothetical protein [Lewinellaceae bacterium]MCB9352580.1 hypothetical protein [Lewinellaceae bacterium]